MAKMLLFQSNRPGGSLEEYVVIVEDETIPIEDYTRPGFEYRASVDIFDDVNLWPTDRELLAEAQSPYPRNERGEHNEHLTHRTANLRRSRR